MELKKCPFCYGDAHIVDYDTSLGYWVECDNCEATSQLCQTEEAAVEAWNKRVELEIVRCKECIYYGEVGDCEVHPHDGRFNVNYFCADGERRNDMK